MYKSKKLGQNLTFDERTRAYIRMEETDQMIMLCFLEMYSGCILFPCAEFHFQINQPVARSLLSSLTKRLKVLQQTALWPLSFRS
nr:hypothetical protein [Tanacetum cinerariifolium]